MWRFLKKLGIKPPYEPAIPLLGIYPGETRVEKDTCIPLFIAAQFTIAITWKQPRYTSTDEWIKKLWYIYTLVAQSVKTLSVMQETQVQPLCQEDPLEKEMATHSSILSWRIP